MYFPLDRPRHRHYRGFRVLSNYKRNAWEPLWKSVKPISKKFFYVKLPFFKFNIGG